MEKSIGDTLKEKQSVVRLRHFVSKINNSANCGLYYKLTEQELIEKLKQIQALTAEALNK